MTKKQFLLILKALLLILRAVVYQNTYQSSKVAHRVLEKDYMIIRDQLYDAYPEVLDEG